MLQLLHVCLIIGLCLLLKKVFGWALNVFFVFLIFSVCVFFMLVFSNPPCSNLGVLKCSNLGVLKCST